MKKNIKYPFKHLSIRVPWHDNKWNGSVCQNPQLNGACLALKEIAAKKDDDKEQKIFGKSLNKLEESEFPACIRERATFMADFDIPVTISHPYAQISPDTHGHLKATRLLFPAFSAPSIPYLWMRKESLKEFVDRYNLDYNEEREPVLKWGTDEEGWVQEYKNQKALLDCFYEHVEEEKSLVFFYAKQVPFIETAGRVIVGVGRVQRIIPSEKYEGSNDKFSAATWEHSVLHSIRNDNKDGFLLPYHEAIEYQKENPDFDLAQIGVLSPEDKQVELSYVSEHVSNDTAIRILLGCLKSWELAEKLGIGSNHKQVIQWIHDEISQLEKLRGFYPGMGAALCAFGIDKGHFIAAEISSFMKKEDNPWHIFEKIIEEKEKIISKETTELIPDNAKKLYKKLKKEKSERLELLHLISRFDIEIEQAKRLYVDEDREEFGIIFSDKQFLDNPYLLFEATIKTDKPITLETIDLGLFLKNVPDHLLPAKLFLDDPLHSNRIRALTVEQLEKASALGHTLLPRKDLIKKIRELSIIPPCPLNKDYYEIAEEIFNGAIDRKQTKNNEVAYQLSHFSHCGEIIRTKISERVGGKAKKNNIPADWRNLIDKKLGEFAASDTQEERARQEKAKAMEEISQSRFSVLIGPAGTGKTTLLAILASQPKVREGNVLLLAPTGKARVRMEEIAKDLDVKALTLAQFLNGYGRYDGRLQRYIFSDKFCEGSFETVIIDEASMLTEEMLATTLDCVKGVKRIILVGDHRQLPPIGAGRPFVDIINWIKPANRESIFPRVAKGFAELTIKRRQGGSKRSDLQLAEWFSGEELEPGADKIINDLINKKETEYLRLINWENENDFEKVLENVLIKELGLKDILDVETFNKSLGSADGTYFNFRQSVNDVESWQILSPVREKVFGVRAINRKIHKIFRKKNIEFANQRYGGKTPRPLGIEEIVYGDKVINLNNQRRYKNVWPDNGLNYIANGEIGIVVGQFKTAKMTFKGQPKNTEVEFTSQKGYKYSFRGREFSEERDNPLELAYALTVHKSQGSEFGKVLLIVPNPCFLLTREMLYTALTRQKDKVIVLFQGSAFDIKELSSPIHSDIARRITNLFEEPDLSEIENGYLEKNLIHQASDGMMLRSKSELVIYQRLLDKGIKPFYEKKLVIKEVEKLPDFTIENDETGEIYYWEHCGMLFDEEYCSRWEDKLKWYKENKILPLEDGGGENGTLIITHDEAVVLEGGNKTGAISVPEIDKIIKKVFDK